MWPIIRYTTDDYQPYNGPITGRLDGPPNRSAHLFMQAKPNVPRASIIWLARAVNVVRPAAPRLHIDRARFAKGMALRIHARGLHVWF